MCKPTTTTTSVCQRAAQGRVWSRRDGARWKPGGTVGPRWDGGTVATGLVGSLDPGCLYLPTLSDTTAQSLPACPGLAYILILCAFYPQSLVHNHFWLVWNSRIPFPCKHYDQNHCVLDNHLLSPVPLQPMSSSAMYYVPISWSVSGTCYCICVCILLQPITQGLCLYIFMSCFLSDPQYFQSLSVRCYSLSIQALYTIRLCPGLYPDQATVFVSTYCSSL